MSLRQWVAARCVQVSASMGQFNFGWSYEWSFVLIILVSVFYPAIKCNFESRKNSQSIDCIVEISCLSENLISKPARINLNIVIVSYSLCYRLITESQACKSRHETIAALRFIQVKCMFLLIAVLSSAIIAHYMSKTFSYLRRHAQICGY